MRASFSAGWVLAVWLSSLFMTQLDVTIVNVAAPSMHADLGASGAELELVVGAYLLGFAVLLITGARLGALLGHRRVFLLGLVAFTAASLLCGLAPDPVFLIAARVVQGMGAALAVPQVLTGIQVSVSEAERPRALGLYALGLPRRSRSESARARKSLAATRPGQPISTDSVRISPPPAATSRASVRPTQPS